MQQSSLAILSDAQPQAPVREASHTTAATCTVHSHLRELCAAILCNEVTSERFHTLLHESGIQLQAVEWQFVLQLLHEQEHRHHVLKNARTASH